MKQILFSSFLIFLMFACQDNNKPSIEAIAVDVNGFDGREILNENLEEYIALVGNLRLRKSPDLKGEVMYSFKEGEGMLFSGNKSDNKDMITIRKKKINENWFEVLVKSNQEIKGWVFGGAIGRKEFESDMPKDRQEKKLSDLTAFELSGIMEIEGVKSNYESYSGSYKYYLTSNGVEIKDGSFMFYGGDGEDTNASYSGSFSNGTKEGIFKEEFSYVGEYEGKHSSDLYFDENGNCSKIHYKGEREGRDYNKIFLDPECLFYDYHKQFTNENRNSVVAVRTEPVNIKPNRAKFTNESLVGSWTIIMKAKVSDCANAKVGDIKTENWLFGIDNGYLDVTKAAGGKRTPSEYYGSVSGNQLKLKNKVSSTTKAKTKVDMEIINSRYMKGTRIVSNTNPCTIIYDITAEKK